MWLISCFFFACLLFCWSIEIYYIYISFIRRCWCWENFSLVFHIICISYYSFIHVSAVPIVVVVVVVVVAVVVVGVHNNNSLTFEFEWSILRCIYMIGGGSNLILSSFWCTHSHNIVMSISAGFICAYTVCGCVCVCVVRTLCVSPHLLCISFFSCCKFIILLVWINFYLFLCFMIFNWCAEYNSCTIVIQHRAM